jgi:hypothetical protein
LFIATTTLSITKFILTINDKETYCGTITHVIDHTYFHKSRGYTDPVWIVQFDNGVKMERHPSWIDYTEHKKGSRVCYEMERSSFDDNFWPPEYFLITFICSLMGLALTNLFNLE